MDQYLSPHDMAASLYYRYLYETLTDVAISSAKILVPALIVGALLSVIVAGFRRNKARDAERARLTSEDGQ